MKEVLAKFPSKDKSLRRTHLYKHRIITENVPPIRQKYYYTSSKDDEVIKKEIEKGLKLGIIRPLSSSWASPIILVIKKDGSIRFYVDYRRLNSVTKRDKYPMPLIDEILDHLGGV